MIRRAADPNLFRTGDDLPPVPDSSGPAEAGESVSAMPVAGGPALGLDGRSDGRGRGAGIHRRQVRAVAGTGAVSERVDGLNVDLDRKDAPRGVGVAREHRV